MLTTISRPTDVSHIGVFMDEGHAAAALFVLQSACLARMTSQQLPVMMAEDHTPITAFLSTCEALTEGDFLAAVAIADLTKFLHPEALRRQRIAYDNDRLGRTVNAMLRAAANGNRPVFETFLRRGLNFLVEPLLAA